MKSILLYYYTYEHHRLSAVASKAIFTLGRAAQLDI